MEASEVGGTRARIRTAERSRLGYVPAIDGLRAVAVLAVVACHNFGWPTHFGVDVFFAMSGFLITTLMWDELQDRRYSRKVFDLKRIVRLMPALMLTLIAAAPIMVALGFDTRTTMLGALFALFYVTPFAPTIGVYGAFGHTWSLAVEEWFYLLWGTMLPDLFTQYSKQVLGAGFIAIWAGTIVLPDDMGYASVLVRGAGILLGAGAALLIMGRTVRAPRACVWLGVAWFGGAVLLTSYGTSVRLATMAAALAGTLICVGAVGGGSRWLGVAPLAWMGRWSYELYLVHYPILAIVVFMLGGLTTRAGLAAMAVALIVAAAMHHLVAPFQKQWRNVIAAPTKN